MRIYRKVYKVPNSYQRVPFEKVKKAVENIVDNVNISSLTAAKKFQFKNKFISDVKKRSDIIGDGKVSQKDLSKAFRESLKEKTLPDKWVTKRYMDLIAKGGISLRSQWEKAPEAKGTSVLQKSPGQSKKFTTKKEVTDFHKRLDESIKARKKQLLPFKLREIEEDGEKKMSRADTERIPENIGQKMTSNKDKNKTGLKSGGKDRIRKDNPASNIPTKKGSYVIRQATPLMTYRESAAVVPAPIKNEIPDNALPKFIAVNSDSKLNSKIQDSGISDDSMYSQSLIEKLELARQAYSDDSAISNEPASEKSTDKDSELGGQKDDSFGWKDQENT